MPTSPYSAALIVGAGPGLGASLARIFTRDGGMQVMVAARRREKLEAIARETGAGVMTCDSTDAASVAALFDAATRHFGAPPEVVVYNASQRVRGAFVDVDAAAVEQAVRITAHGAFLVAQQAARRMLARGSGSLLFTGASASVKGYAGSAPFAMGKFAVRGLAQSLARELAPRNIHVAHFVIDGAVRSTERPEPSPDSFLDPAAIAGTYWSVVRQPRSAWTWEVELRPWVEKF